MPPHFDTEQQQHFSVLALSGSSLQSREASMGVEGAVCVVTGGSGLTGRRLVEMLAEKGAARVVSFDIAPKPADAIEHPAIEYQQVLYNIIF